ncbi:MAG: crotonase/enoyl-CoA hydratase family protein [Gammaproteobacteria bacterium]
MTFETIEVTLEEGIQILKLNRPDRMNAFNTRMQYEIVDALEQAAQDTEVKAVVFTGHGTRAYCAGADLEQGGETFNYRQRSERTGREDDGRDGGGKVTLALYDFPKLVVGAINGAAVGIGVTMTLPMDIRLASENARFGFVFARRGIIPEAASSWFLPRLVGIQQALDWCYSGRVFGAEEALSAGLVSAVVPADQLLSEAKRRVREIIDNCAPISVALTRQMMWKMLGADHPMEAHKVDSRAIRALGKMPDAREGIQSFLEKRAPEFTGQVPTDMPDLYPFWTDRKFK